MNLDPVSTLLGPLRVARPGDLACRSTIERLCRRGLLERATAPVRLRPVTEAPLVAWNPGEAFPLTPGQLEYRLRKAWESAPVRRVCVVYATRRAANLYGGRGGRPTKPLQIGHDLLTAAVYFRRGPRDGVGEWVGERVTLGDYRPDAVLVDARGRVARAIEVGGLYPARRIARLVAACHDHGIPLELW